jgi:hypothetical protein
MLFFNQKSRHKIAVSLISYIAPVAGLSMVVVAVVDFLCVQKLGGIC